MTDQAVDIVELPYHRLLRAQPTYRAWRPLVAIVMTLVFFLGVSLVVAIPVLIVVLTTGAVDVFSPTVAEDLTRLITPDMARPWTVAFGLGSIILVLPLVPVALKIAGIAPSGVRVNILHSVLFRLRWRWLGVAVIPAAVVWIGTTAVQLGLGVAFGEPLGAFTADLPTYLVGVLIVLVLVPVQAATEEYLYRGVLLQSLGAWWGWVPFTVVISSAAFAFSHAYDEWGIATVAVMGIGFAVVTIRTGGLEAGIAMHAVNNIGAFVLSGTGMFGPTGITEDTGGVAGFVAQVVTVALWVLGVELAARRVGIERRSRIGVPARPAGIELPYGG